MKGREKKHYYEVYYSVVVACVLFKARASRKLSLIYYFVSVYLIFIFSSWFIYYYLFK